MHFIQLLGYISPHSIFCIFTAPSLYLSALIIQPSNVSTIYITCLLLSKYPNLCFSIMLTQIYITMFYDITDITSGVPCAAMRYIWHTLRKFFFDCALFWYSELIRLPLMVPYCYYTIPFLRIPLEYITCVGIGQWLLTITIKVNQKTTR